jgi:hypothetical protein
MAVRNEEFVLNLNLMLIILTSWMEDSRRNPGTKTIKAWKGYLFEILDTLEEKKLINQHGSTQLLFVNRAGMQQGIEFMKKHFPEEYEGYKEEMEEMLKNAIDKKDSHSII